MLLFRCMLVQVLGKPHWYRGVGGEKGDRPVLGGGRPVLPSSPALIYFRGGRGSETDERISRFRLAESF